MSRLDPILSGVSGQYFVAGELSRRGFVATVTLRNTRGIDVLAANSLGSKTVSIQVKTNQGSNREWMLSAKSDTTSAEDLFYVFVNLNGKDMPSFHIVESAIVAKFTADGHKLWLSKPKRNNQPRKNTSMRIFRDDSCEYLNAWHRLGLDDIATT